MVVKGKLPAHFVKRGGVGGLKLSYAPTLAVVSVRLFRVVDLPLEGLPTRAMRGSRGMFSGYYWRKSDVLGSGMKGIGIYR